MPRATLHQGSEVNKQQEQQPLDLVELFFFDLFGLSVRIRVFDPFTLTADIRNHT